MVMPVPGIWHIIPGAAGGVNKVDGDCCI